MVPNTRGVSETGSSRVSPSPAAVTQPPTASPLGKRRETVTVYGPRRSNEQGESDLKVTARIDPGHTGRLMVTFHNVDIKGKGAAVEETAGQGQGCDEAVHMFDQLELGKH